MPFYLSVVSKEGIMKDSFVKYGILLVMSMAAVFIAKAGHPAFAMWILSVGVPTDK